MVNFGKKWRNFWQKIFDKKNYVGHFVANDGKKPKCVPKPRVAVGTGTPATNKNIWNKNIRNKNI